MGFTLSCITVALVLVVGLAAREVVLFIRGRQAYGLRRLTLRLATSGMLGFLFASLLIGISRFRLDRLEGAHPYFLAYWGCIALLTVAILCLVVADLKQVGDEASDHANRIWREIAETIAARDAKIGRDD